MKETFYLKEALLNAADKLRKQSISMQQAARLLRKVGVEYDEVALVHALQAVDTATDTLNNYAETIK